MIDWIELGMLLLVPAAMVILGLIFLVRPPKKINDWFGYRTRRAMASQAAWDFAHRVCGRTWLCWGGILAALTLLAALVMGWETLPDWSGTAVLLQCGALILTTVPVDQALKKNFDQDGNRITDEIRK